MTAPLGAAAVALLAGALSVLSPCVLPLLPLVFGGAASAHRFGPALLAGGVALSFVALGLLLATLGFAIGLDEETLRVAAAALMIAVGLALLVPALQTRLAVLGGRFGDRIDAAGRRISTEGPLGSLLLGALLGAAWSPCVGPTLGAASALAAQGRDLPQAALVMAAFGLGAALPLAALGTLSREAFARWRGTLLASGQAAKRGLGLLLVAFGLLIVTGANRPLEAALVAASPGWLTELTTRN